ncbi:MAG: YfhO family protein [Bacteroidetes bacterium]|nr:YfhO family protein [Bacteroidota bacterium]
MKPSFFKKALPHIIAVAIFAIVSILYCKPALEGKVLNQHDIQGWKGMSKQSFDVKEKTGRFPLWTNSMFGGMPTYQIAIEGTTKITSGIGYIQDALRLWLPEPISFFFLASLCFYLLCICAGANPVAGILGALAYAYSTYDPVIITAGHNTKMYSIAYAPMIVAGILLLYNRKYLSGFIITAFFAAVTIGQNHMQIVYYFTIIAGAIAIAAAVKFYKEKQLAHFAKASALALLAGMLGLGVCATGILPTYDYSKETMRGGASQLTLDKTDSITNNKTKGGLDKDYALRWSIGKMETFTILVPGLYGGSNGGDEHNTSSRMVQKFTEVGVPEESALGAVNGYSYWGSMSSLSETTSGPVYMGAIVCFLFIFGLFYVKSWHKWWIVGASILGVLLAWGSNFMAFNAFLLDHLPLYNKFRAPSMAMVIPQFCLPFLAVLAVNQLFSETDWDNTFKIFKKAVAATGVVLGIVAIFWLMADYTGKGDTDIRKNFTSSFSRTQPGQPADPQVMQQAEQLSKDLMTALRDDRKTEAGGDLLRSLLLIGAAVIIVGLIAKKKTTPLMGTMILAALVTIDQLMVDARYLNYSKFKEKDEVAEEFTPSPADQQILKDPDHANFRVFNQTTNFTNEAMTSYFHNSIGGYHPAKLGLYQDLIEYQISKGNMNVFDMLNTKYFIAQDPSGRVVAEQNPNAYGSCWLVKGLKYVATPNEEMLALDSTNLRDTAILNQSFKATVTAAPQYDSSASIKISDRQNDLITYVFNSTTPQYAVFSEIYYNRGWNAYIDDKKVDYAKVDYLLRGLNIPAGKHTIVFKFEPKAYYLGNSITLWSTIILYLLIVLTVVLLVKDRNKE